MMAISRHIERGLDLVSSAAFLVSVALLVLLMFLGTLDVVMTQIFLHSIPGVVELSEAAMAVVVVLAAAADLARPEASRSHLGRFASRVLDEGPSAITESFLRKQSANFRILGGSTWTDLLPIVAIFLVVTLVVWRWWGDALPPGSARRIGFVGVLGAAALGFASNDSGPIVIALFVAFLAPFVLLAVRSARRPTEPVVVTARASTEQVPA